MKKYRHILLAFTSIVLFIFVLQSTVDAQNHLNFAYSETTTTLNSESTTYANVLSQSIDLTNANAVMVLVNFEVSSYDGNGTREALYKIIEGSNSSNVIERTMTRGDGTDFGMGTLVHIFEYADFTGSKTFSLQHSTSNASKGISSNATMTIIEINTSSIPLSYDIKEIISAVIAPDTYTLVTGMETDAINLTKPGGIYVAASFNSEKSITGAVTDAAEWILRYKKEVSGTWIEMGKSITRTFGGSSDIGAGSLVWILNNQEPGDYYFQLVHRKSSGLANVNLNTLNASLVALGLSHSGGLFPGFAQTEESVQTNAVEAIATSRSGTSLNSGSDLLLHGQFVIQASAALNSPSFSWEVSDDASYFFESKKLKRNISSVTDRGSGALIALASDLAMGTTYTASLMHGTPDPGVTITSTNIVMCGFRLTDMSVPNVWTGSGDTDFTTAGNWDENEIPSETAIYIPVNGITNFPVIDSTDAVTVNDITVYPGASLSMRSNKNYSASLIVNGTASGDISYERHLSKDRWYLVSAPVGDQSINAFLDDTDGDAHTNQIPVNGSDQYGVIDYNEATNSWGSYFTIGTTGNFASGQGYLMRKTTSDGPVTFTGSIISDTHPVTITNAGYGWQCLGNPYTSPIGITTDAVSPADFLTVNSGLFDPSYIAIYLWDEAAGYSGTQNNYKVISNTGYTDPMSSTALDMDYIQPGQAFMIKGVDVGGTMNFTQAMQIHHTDNYMKSAEKSWDGFKMVASNNDIEKSTILAFNENLSTGLDPSFDVGLFKEDNNFRIYSVLANLESDVKFGIQCLPDRDFGEIEVPLGVIFTEGGELEFNAESIVRANTYKVVLEDRLNNEFIKMIPELETYTVTLPENTDVADRFFIHITEGEIATTLNLQENSSFKAYQRNNYIILEGETNPGTTASLYDIKGRLLTTYTLNNTFTNLLNLDINQAGIYVLLIQDQNQNSSIKIPLHTF